MNKTMDSPPRRSKRQQVQPKAPCQREFRECRITIPEFRNREKFSPTLHEIGDAEDYFLEFNDKLKRKARQIIQPRETFGGTLALGVLVSAASCGWQSNVVDWLFAVARKAVRSPGQSFSQVNSSVTVTAIFEPSSRSTTDMTRREEKLLANKKNFRLNDVEGATSMTEEPLVEQHNSTREEQLKSAAEKVKAAVDAAVAAYSDDNKLGDACDAYTIAAKSFASQILAERIRQPFSRTIDETTGKSVESAEEKSDTARTIRDWLSPWNLGFHHPANPKAGFQLYADGNGVKNGRYRLIGYGLSRKEEAYRLSGWEDIRQSILAPELVDVTEFVYHHPLRSVSR